MLDKRVTLDPTTSVILAPFELGSPYGGTGDGPAAIVSGAFGENWHTEIGLNQIVSLRESKWTALDRPTLRAQVDRLLPMPGRLPILLGGCHTLTFYAMERLLAEYSDLVLVVFDAHSDNAPRQGMEITHGSHLTHLCASYAFDLIHIGGRYDVARLYQLTSHFLTAAEIRKACSTEGFTRSVRDWIGNRPVYLSFDVDVLDPTVMPGVNFPCRDGLFLDTVLAFISAGVGEYIVAGDIVEYVPSRDTGRVGLFSICQVFEAMQRNRHPRAALPGRCSSSLSRLPRRGSDFAEAAARREELCQLLYGCSLSKLAMTTGYHLPPTKPVFHTAWSRFGKSIACTSDPNILAALNSSDTQVVIGGPCTYQLFKPVDITFREVMEIASVVATAKAMDAHGIIYVDDNFALTSSGNDESFNHIDANQAVRSDIFAIRSMKAFFRELIEAITSAYGLPPNRLWIAWHSELRRSEVFRANIELTRRMLNTNYDDCLYEASNKPRSVRNSKVSSEITLTEWAETLATYLPATAAEVVGAPVTQVLIRENLDQAKAIRLILDGTKCLRSGHSQIVHLAHLPSPTMRGRLVQRSASIERPRPADDYDRLLGELATASAPVRYAYEWGMPTVGEDVDDASFGRFFQIVTAVKAILPRYTVSQTP